MQLNEMMSSCTASFTRKWIVLCAIGVLVIFLLLSNPSSNVQNIPNQRVHNVRDPASRRHTSRLPERTSRARNVTDHNINAKEQWKWTYDFSGYCFDESGATERITSRVTSSLIHSFSPYVEREAAKRFVDPPHSNVYYANSPAVAWRDGK